MNDHERTVIFNGAYLQGMAAAKAFLETKGADANAIFALDFYLRSSIVALEFPTAPGRLPRAEQWEAWDLVEFLREDECDSVEIIHDNPDFHGPNSIVQCRGFWVDPDHAVALDCGRQFSGETIIHALRAAADAKRQAKGAAR